jgi:hypothetical protein
MAKIEAPKLSPAQIENIVDRLVPLIAAPEDHEFFKGVLFCYAETKSSAQFHAFVAKLLIPTFGSAA